MIHVSKKALTVACIAMVLTGTTAHYFYDGGVANAESAPAGAPAMPPMPVTVEMVKSAPVTIWKEFSGRLQAVDQAAIRPQVSGLITDLKFSDGQVVNKGDVIYVIDPRPYAAAVEKAKADLASAKDQYNFAQKEMDRAAGLIKTEAISRRIYDERVNARNTAKSMVDSAKAQLEQAQINLDNAYVKAPISGRVSRAEITVGNLVEAGANAPILTTIVSNEGIYADFDVDEQTYVKNVRSSAQNIGEEQKIPVRLLLQDGQKSYEGNIHSFDNQINPASGTIRARAFFKNEDRTLIPGLFARVQMGSADVENKILVSEKAIGTDQNRKFVYVVSPENTVAYREVQLGDTYNGQRVILGGLKDGDKVIADNLIKLRPDMPVQIVK